jgi:hypothetical protein
MKLLFVSFVQLFRIIPLIFHNHVYRIPDLKNINPNLFFLMLKFDSPSNPVPYLASK